MIKVRYRVLLLGILVCGAQLLNAQDYNALSPIEYGLQTANNGEERFWALYKTHQAAYIEGKNVDYSGIDTISIEIPASAKSIPLSPRNNFKGVTFKVSNRNKDFFLFTYINTSYPIRVSKTRIDQGCFKYNEQISRGRYLLCIEDMNLWVKQREGHDYGHTRKDILLIENGVAFNKPVMPYNNRYSKPECKYYPISDDGLLISDLTLFRAKESSHMTFLCEVEGIDGLVVQNVSINTPENNGENDQIITINNCSNVSFKNLRINGTYSRSDYSGYGVAMNNIWNFRADSIYCNGNWGVFGTNNVNVSSISNSEINRYDIHCYGRDVSFKNVKFSNKYNQFSSVYGTINFDNCSFTNCVPLVNGHSYNAYVGYNVVFNNCEYSTIYDTPILIDEGYLDNAINQRPELSKRCLPNISINNLRMSIPKVAPIVYLFFFRERGDYHNDIGYLSELSINNLVLNYEGDVNRTPADFMISNVPINVENQLNEYVADVDIIGNSALRSKKKGILVSNLLTKSYNSTLNTNNVKATAIVKNNN